MEGGHHIPFDIARIYYLYDIPANASRGGHAHKKLERVIFALSGSFRVIVDDGKQKQKYWLKDPHEGLYINQLVWTDLDAFSPNAVCAVLASHRYDEEDYYRDYNEFLDAVL